LIGETEIDLERRWFHPLYQQKIVDQKKFKYIPVESRTLYSQTGDKMARGAIRLWIEIVPKFFENSFPVSRLMSQNVDLYEMRLVIWNTRCIPFKEGSSKVDIHVKVQMFNGKSEIEEV